MVGFVYTFDQHFPIFVKRISKKGKRQKEPFMIQIVVMVTNDQLVLES